MPSNWRQHGEFKHDMQSNQNYKLTKQVKQTESLISQMYYSSVKFRILTDHK
jgi:hypothetical protein